MSYPVGTKVICIDGNCVPDDAWRSRILKGKAYTISSICPHGHVQLEGVVGRFSPTRFIRGVS